MPFEYDFSEKLKKKVEKLVGKNRKRSEILHKKVLEIISSDKASIDRYKNLRYGMDDQKRVHIDKSFVLTFNVDKKRNFILFLDFDRHDRIYGR
ncbi:MAG: hypothetical protein WC602_05200 [archaeon]